MTMGTIGSLAGFVAVVLLASTGPGAAETLRVGGIGTATRVMPTLFNAFDPGEVHRLEMFPNLGTGGGLGALADGVLDMAVAGRPLNPEERARGLTEAAAMRTPFVLVTSRRSAEALSSAAIAEILTAPRATWPDGSLIRLILRPRSSDSSAQLGRLPGVAPALEQARRRHDLPITATSEDNAALAERIPGSLTTSTFSQIMIERRDLRLIAVDGLTPSLEALENATYPLERAFYFVLPARSSTLAQRFVAFLRTPAGRAALRASGNLPVAE
jgi:phosphate transport system substrate-binding protein